MSITERVEQGVRRTALVSAGTLLCLIGGGFLTAAAWIGLSALLSPLHAATIIGCAYVGVGLCIIGLSRLRHEAPNSGPSTPKAQDTQAPALMEAFLHGLKAGAQTRSSR